MASAATLTMMNRPGPSPSSSRSIWNVYRPDPANPPSTRSSVLYTPSEFTFNASWSPLTDVEFGAQVYRSHSQLSRILVGDQKHPHHSRNAHQRRPQHHYRAIATQRKRVVEDDRVSHLDFGSDSEGSDAETINLKDNKDKDKDKDKDKTGDRGSAEDKQGVQRLEQEEVDEGFYDFDEHFDGLDYNATEAFLYYYTSDDDYYASATTSAATATTSKADPRAETNAAYLASYGYTNGLGYERELGYGVGLGLTRKQSTSMDVKKPPPLMTKKTSDVKVRPPVFARAVVRRISSVQALRRIQQDIVPITPSEVLLNPYAFAYALCDKVGIDKGDKLRTNPHAAWEDEYWAELEEDESDRNDDYNESILDLTEANDHDQDEAIEEEDWQAYTDVGVEFPPTSPTTPTTLASSARNSWLEHAGTRAQAARHARMAITLRFPNVPSHVPFPSSTPDTAIVDQQNFIRDCSASANFSNSSSAPASIRSTPIDPVLTPTPAVTPPLRLSAIYPHECVPRYRPLSDPPPYTADAPPPPPPTSALDSFDRGVNGADVSADTETIIGEQERQPMDMSETQSDSRPQSPEENRGTFGPVRLSEILGPPPSNLIHSSTPDSAERAEVDDNVSPLPRSVSPIYTLHGAVISPRPTFPPTSHRSALSFPRSPTESISTLATLTSFSATSDATITTPGGVSSPIRFPFIRPQETIEYASTSGNNMASSRNGDSNNNTANKRPLPVPPPPLLRPNGNTPITPITPSSDSSASVYSVPHSTDVKARRKRRAGVDALDVLDADAEIEDVEADGEGGWISVRVSETEEIPITLAPVRSSHFHAAYPSQSISNFSLSSSSILQLPQQQGGITETEVDISRLPWEAPKMTVGRRQPSPFRRLATLSRRFAPGNNVNGSRDR